jgi:formylmethanofuran dehydrogenase subunit E
METKELMKKATLFHGHLCPGVAIGVLAAKLFLKYGFEHSPDEELVAVVETDNCSIDALQAILSTTYGKGNLIHHDYGKNNYTLYSRKKQKAIRLSLKASVLDDKRLSRDEKIQNLLSLEPEQIFDVKEVEYDPPSMALSEESVPCEICGELTMSSRIMNYQNRNMCIPCYKQLKK